MNEQESMLLALIALSPEFFKTDRFWETKLTGDPLAVAKRVVDDIKSDSDIEEAANSILKWAKAQRRPPSSVENICAHK